MAMTSSFGDRREHPRFDITGRLWASVEFVERVVVRNIALGGALVESQWLGAQDSIRAVQVVLREGGPEMNAITRHVSRIAGQHGEDRYLIGLEFTHLSPTASESLERFISEWAHENPAV